MKKAYVLCICQGTCPSFGAMNTMEILNRLRRDKAVDLVALHPQLCADDGEVFLDAFLKDSGITRFYVAGCDNRMQQKMFRDAFDSSGFDKAQHFGVDIRNLDTDQVVEISKKLIKDNP